MDGMREAKEAISGARKIIVAGHINPDGDSIGSILSLGLGLERIKKRVTFVSADGVPERYRALPGARKITRSTDEIADLAIAVDCGTKELLGSTFTAFGRAKHVLEIDHHEFRRPYGDLRFVDYEAAAVGELVYLLLMDLNVRITKDIAQNILTSIIVETGSFRLPDVRPLTFEICAKLMDNGVDFYKLVETVFWSRSKEASALLGICLERCVYAKRGRLVWSIVRKDDFERTGGSDEDVDPVVDEMRSIKGVKVAILFREKHDGVLRVSLRSKGRINIAALAERYGGGGHFDAAGCYIPNAAESIETFLRHASRMIT